MQRLKRIKKPNINPERVLEASDTIKGVMRGIDDADLLKKGADAIEKLQVFYESFKEIRHGKKQE